MGWCQLGCANVPKLCRKITTATVSGAEIGTEQTTSCSSEKCQTYPKIVLTMNSWSECSLHDFILDFKRCKFCHVAVWSQFELQCMYVLA
jgi:hypothetical protein